VRPGAADNRQDRRQNFAQNQPQRIENREQWQQNRQQRVDQVRNQVAQNYPRMNFWNNYPNWASWRIATPYRWATWGALGSWIGYGTAQPVYNDYGSNVYYQDNSVYSGEQPVATAEQYTEQAAAIASTGANTDPASSEWLPLGVFALTQDGQSSGATPSVYIQLAVNKQGIVSGTLNHQLTGETQQLEGAVDKQSQRVAWTVKGEQHPIVETSLGNLTKDTAPVLLHFAEGQTQQWLLVRLPEPMQQ
jgi:hypothetical protein